MLPLFYVLSPSPGRAVTGTLSLATKDGLEMTLNADSSVDDITVHGDELAELPSGGGFSLRMVGGNPNLIPNADFETDSDGNGVPDGWRFTSSTLGPPALTDAVAHGGSRSVVLTNATRGNSGHFSVAMPVKANTDYFLSGWFRSEDIVPTAPPAHTPSNLSPLRIKVQQLDSEGKVVAVATAFGYTNTADWNRQFVGFKTRGPVTHVRIVGAIVNGSGTAWIDDLSLSVLFRPGSIPVKGGVAATGDGTGSVAQHAELSDEDLALDATYTPKDDHIRVEGVVTGTGASDRAFELTYSLPVNAAGWSWEDYARKARTISKGTYAYETRWNVQPGSRYPFGTIAGNAAALTLGMPLDQPRIGRVRYNTSRGFSISFDLGVSRATTRMGPRATFSFVIYHSDPAWGFRASTKKYYDIYPHFFTRRTDPAREGIWYRRAPLGSLTETWADFGLGLNMIAVGVDNTGAEEPWGTEYLPWDNERGIYASAYNHHWVYRHKMLSDEVPTYEEEIARLEADANVTPTDWVETRSRDRAQAALVSTARDYNGRMLYERYRTSMSYYENLDPQTTDAMDWPEAVHTYQVQRALDLAASVPARLDGIHLDSTSGMRRWAASDNYNRPQWEVTDTPLTFSYDTGLVTQRLVFPISSHIRRLAGFLRDRGMILSANFNGSEARTAAWFGADLIDYFGIEQGLPEKTGSNDRYVTLDSFAIYKRTLAYQRPVSTLDEKLDDGSLTAAQIIGRLQRNLFYGIFAGPGVDGKFFTEDHRDLYAPYTPLFKRLAAAGWEPVTNARSSNAKVWIERFGYVSKGNLHLTLRNETGSEQTYSIAVALNKDGLARVSEVNATELVTSTPVAIELNADGTKATIAGTIPAWRTRLIAFDARP